MPQELLWYDGPLPRRHQVSPPLSSDPCVYIYNDDVGFMTLTLYVYVFLVLGANKLPLNKLKKQLMDRLEMTDMGDVMRVLSMNVARDAENETVAMNQRDYTKDVIDPFDTKGYNPACMLEVQPEASLNQSETNAGYGGHGTLPIHDGWCHAAWAGFPLRHRICS